MTTPYPYQAKGVRKILHFKGRALLADEMGLGKTPQTYWAIEKLLKPKDIVVVVCPKIAKETWRTEALIHIRANPIVLNGRRVPKKKPSVQTSRFFVINYDILGNPNAKKSWVRWLKKLKPKCVVIDECHYIKNLSAQRTKSVFALCNGVKHVIALSGTPMTSQIADIWPTLHLIRPDKFQSFFPFGMKYCGGRRTPWGWEFKGATKVKELHRKLNKWCMIRRLKKDVLPDLPAKTRTVLKVPISNVREYREAEQHFIKWLMKKSRRKALRAASAEKLVQLGYLKRLAAELKLKAIIEWIDNYLATTDQKLIVFGIHKAVLRPLLEKYKKIAVLVDGTVTGEKRTAAIAKFNNDTSTRLLIGNMHAAGVAWSCKSTSNVLMVELDWVPGNHSQAEDRVHGVGRGKKGQKANIWYLIASGTIEEKICRILQGRQGVFDRVLDGIDKVSGMDIYKQLEKLYLGMAA